MVFQSFALYPHLTVYENFAYPLREEKVGREEIDKRVKETAAMLKLSHRLERKPNTLSGGEQQRVALGRSLIRRPKILLLDEPLTNLDAKLRHDMRAELKRLHRQFGMTIVYATPDELEALSMGEEIAVMRDGAVVQRGTPDELYEQPGRYLCGGQDRLAAHEHDEGDARRRSAEPSTRRWASSSSDAPRQDAAMRARRPSSASARATCGSPATGEAADRLDACI